MRRKLLLSAISKFIIGLIMISLLLFLPAGTIYYWNGWLFIGLLFIPMFLLGAILLLKAPELLEKRLNNKEKEKEQKQVVALSFLLFVGGFVVSALDFRFRWSNLPLGIVIAAAVILLISYGLYAEVMRENAYLSRTVEIQENQKVIDTGLYGIVRHPMYFATTLLFLSFPIVLVKRIKNEEVILENGLPGYKEYKQRVKYRLFPFIW